MPEKNKQEEFKVNKSTKELLDPKKQDEITGIPHAGRKETGTGASDTSEGTETEGIKAGGPVDCGEQDIKGYNQKLG